MRFVQITSNTALLLLLGTLIPAYAQHERGEKQDKPERQQSRQEQAAPQQQQPQQERQRQEQRVQQPQQERQRQEQRVQQPRQERQQQEQRVQQPRQERQQQQQEQRFRQGREQQQPHRTQQQAAHWQQQRGWAQQGGWQPHSTWQQGRARRWESEHRDWGQRGGYGGYYIPQASFSISFGSQHWFRMHSRPTMYMGYPRFAYGGYSFMLVDPYPEYWEEDWYDTDDIYIDYDNGYYLHNRRYPGIGLAITVAM